MTPTELPTPVERLYRHFTEHASVEADLIAEYRHLAEQPTTPEAVRYLIRLVVEDEERHHRLFHDLAVALDNSLTWGHDSGAVPDMPFGEPSPALADATARFLAAEQADQKQLRDLRRELEPFRDTTLWTLLVEIMESDTEKHIRLLSFIRDHVALKGVHRGTTS